jgi:hypothetical protein
MKVEVSLWWNIRQNRKTAACQMANNDAFRNGSYHQIIVFWLVLDSISNRRTIRNFPSMMSVECFFFVFIFEVSLWSLKSHVKRFLWWKILHKYSVQCFTVSMVFFLILFYFFNVNLPVLLLALFQTLWHPEKYFTRR